MSYQLPLTEDELRAVTAFADQIVARGLMTASSVEIETIRRLVRDYRVHQRNTEIEGKRAHYLLAPSTVIVRCVDVAVELEMPDTHARDVLTELTTKADGMNADYDAMIKIPKDMPTRLYLRRSQAEQLVKQLIDLGVVEATS